MEFGTRIRTHKEEMGMTMTVRIEIEGKAEDFQELFVPSDRQQEFMEMTFDCLLYTSPSPRDGLLSRMPSSA